MSVRYMGTKRHMATHVQSALFDVAQAGPVLDLFSGMGTVAEAMAGQAHVVTNDALGFTTAFARARFTAMARPRTVEEVVEALRPTFARVRTRLHSRFRTQLSAEDLAARSGASGLRSYFARAPHVGNSLKARRAAERAACATDESRYCLATLYFSAGYLSLRQAIDIDALRAAIDEDAADDIDWLIAAWLRSVSLAVNAPGHTAQFLSPTSDEGAARVSRAWRHDVISDFQVALRELPQVGHDTWRAGNAVRNADAMATLASDDLPQLGAIYADPPYTRDQYSRFYHVYETLYRYDFPDSQGAGRTRSDRFTTGFSRKSEVKEAFDQLLAGAAAHNVPFVLSYPENGLLQAAGYDVVRVACEHFNAVEVRTVEATHSTLGASTGKPTKQASELIVICTDE